MKNQKPLPIWFFPILVISGTVAFFLGSKKVVEHIPAIDDAKLE